MLVALQSAKLDAAEDVDLPRVFLADEIDVVVVAAEGTLVAVLPHVGGVAEDIVAGKANAVVVVGDAEGVQTSRDGGLHDGLGGVLAAEGVVGVGMKILKHRGISPLCMRYREVRSDFFYYNYYNTYPTLFQGLWHSLWNKNGEGMMVIPSPIRLYWVELAIIVSTTSRIFFCSCKGSPFIFSDS